MHDSHGALESASRALSLYLNQVGRRALLYKLGRGLAFALGAGLAALSICALSAGPSLGWLGACLTWAAVLLCVALAGSVGVGRLDDLRGARRAVLLEGYDPRLSARARSAAELAHAPNGSPELISALTRSVLDELEKAPLREVVPRPERWGRMSSLSTALSLGCALLLSSSEHAGSGLYAMLHPALRDDHGTPVGLWVGKLEAKVTKPRHLGGETTLLASPREIHVPEGAMIELSVTPRFAIDRAVLQLGDRTLPMTRTPDGRYRVTLTAEYGGTLALRARVDDDWVTDPLARRLEVDRDMPPSITLEAPLADQQAALDEPVPFVFRVDDDHGLEGVDLVVRLGPGRERHTRLLAFPAEPATKTQTSSTEVIPRDFGALSGQTIVVWLEARDRDGFGGPNLGRSPVRTITVGEAPDARGAPVELLERTRDMAVDALGGRLEAPIPPRNPELAARTDTLGKTTKALVRQLDALAKAYDDSTGDRATTGVMHDMQHRLQRLHREEATADDAREVRERDGSLVSELEDDALWLSDLIGRAKLSNAEQVLERLNATRVRMRELLEQLKKTDDPARRSELLAEIARARAELSELAQKLAQAERDVPSDFVNYEALAEQAADDPLEKLEDALRRGDMEAAEKAMAELDERLAGLEKGLESGDQAFADARFSPRNAAVERARSEVKELERAQKQIANETGRVGDTAAARRAQDEATREQANRLAQEADALEKRTRDLEAGRVQSAVNDAQATAAQRLRDAKDALKQGDLDEAAQMAQRAANDLGAVANEMNMDARMFPGPDGSRSEAAKRANQLARDVTRFAEQVAEARPEPSEQLSENEMGQLKKQAPGQRALGDEGKRLSDELAKDAPSSVEDGLERATRSMQRAAESLEKGDVREAQAHQRDALEKLGELNEQLEQQARASKRGGGEGDGSERIGSDEKVTIPNSSDDPRRADLRRRVLDARRAKAPDSFSRAVERYYQEILR